MDLSSEFAAGTKECPASLPVPADETLRYAHGPNKKNKTQSLKVRTAE